MTPNMASAATFIRAIGLEGLLNGIETGMLADSAIGLAFKVIEDAVTDDAFTAKRKVPDVLKKAVSGYTYASPSERDTLARVAHPLFRKHRSLLRAALNTRLQAAEPPVSVDVRKLHDILSRHVQSLEMSVRLTHIFERGKIILIGELVQTSVPDFLRIRNAGRKTLKEVKDLLEGLSQEQGIRLELGMDVRGWQRPVSGIVSDFPVLTSPSHPHEK